MTITKTTRSVRRARQRPKLALSDVKRKLTIDRGRCVDRSHLKTESAGLPVVVVLHAPRQNIHANRAVGSSLLWMHELLAELCQREALVDLTADFAERYQRTGIKYETPYDGH